MKLGIIGLGQLGTSIASYVTWYRMASQLVLVDKDFDRAKKVALDMEQGNSVTNVDVLAGGYELLIDADIVIVAAGSHRKNNETRVDLVGRNQDVVSDVVNNLINHNADCILIILTEPVDIMSYVALKVSGYRKHRVLGVGTIVDSIRFNSLLAKYFKFNPEDVDLMVIGEHGENMVPVVADLKIKNMVLREHSLWNDEEFSSLLKKLTRCGDDLVALGQNAIFTPTIAVGRFLSSILKDKKNILPVSHYVSGDYGVKNVTLSLPVVLGRNGVEEVVSIALSDEEERALQVSAGIIRSSIDML
jgi:L-lactate dehydrogenase